MYLILIFIFLIDLYIFQGIKTLTANFDSESTRKMVHWGFWIANLAFMAIIAFGFLSFDRAKGLKTYQLLAFNAFILLMIPKLVFAIVLLGQDMFRLF